tara:strand:- start:6314 stop:6580 length:267 start_codon:yes stop_codon:yes gene_type:complete
MKKQGNHMVDLPQPELDTAMEALNEMKERLSELIEVRDKLWDLLGLIEEVEGLLPSDIMGSHHADMEYGDTLEQVEGEIQDIEYKVTQ